MSEGKNTAAAQQKAKRKEEEMPYKGRGKRTMAYIGPTIKNVAVTGSLYTNGLPEALENEIKERPLVGELVIPVERLAEAKKELATPGSALATVYRKAEGK